MAYPIFTTPDIQYPTKEEIVIPLAQDILAPGAQNTLISSRIAVPFRIVQVKMFFTFNTNNLLRYYWLVSGDNIPSTTGIPSGNNPFSGVGTLPYFVGEGLMRKELCPYRDVDGRKYIKLHAVNGSPVAQPINASVTIQRL
jgi:hypothetical protein